MRIHFADPLFDAQLLRALSAVFYGGAEVGECLTTARRIRPLDVGSWHDEWLRVAERNEQAGDDSLRAGRPVSAREAFLRAATYYRTAYLFLFETPVDARLLRAFESQVRAFRRAAALFEPAAEVVAIPYQGTTLPGYFLRVDDSGVARPTVLLISGYDSTAEELYTYTAAAALQRGYNCLCFDGPGQGAMLIQQGVLMRPDWEHIIAPVLDFALARPDVDARRVALIGASFGGYLAPRAASGEPRLAACVADPGQYDLFDAFRQRIPAPLARHVPDGNRVALALLARLLERLRRHPTKGWGLRRGMWVHGAATPLDYLRLARDYTLRGRVEQIACPTLVCFAEEDAIAAQARQLFDALRCDKQFLTFTAAEGAGDHCEGGNRSLLHQRVFDWLDAVLERI